MDKLFAAEHYYRIKKYFDLSKHLYDLSILLNDNRINKLFKNDDLFSTILKIQLDEEKVRFGGISDFNSFNDFQFGDNLSNDVLIKNFNQMQSIYVLNNSDIIKYEEMKEKIKFLFNEIKDHKI